MRREIEKTEPVYKNIGEVSEPLLQESRNLEVENGVDVISNEIEVLKGRWDSLSVFVDERDGQIDELQDSVTNITKELKPIEELMSQIETFVSYPIGFGDDVTKGKEVLGKIEVR